MNVKKLFLFLFLFVLTGSFVACDPDKPDPDKPDPDKPAPSLSAEAQKFVGTWVGRLRYYDSYGDREKTLVEVNFKDDGTGTHSLFGSFTWEVDASAEILVISGKGRYDYELKSSKGTTKLELEADNDEEYKLYKTLVVPKSKDIIGTWRINYDVDEYEQISFLSDGQGTSRYVYKDDRDTDSFIWSLRGNIIQCLFDDEYENFCVIDIRSNSMTAVDPDGDVVTATRM